MKIEIQMNNKLHSTKTQIIVILTLHFYNITLSMYKHGIIKE